MGEYTQGDTVPSTSYLPKFRRTADSPKAANNLPKIMKTFHRAKTTGLPKITKTVDHMKISEDRWIECFRIVDTVLTKVIQVQQLHMNAIWNFCTIADTGTRQCFVEKQIQECKHLEEEMRSLKRVMLERAINSEANTASVTSTPECSMESTIIDSPPTFHCDLGREIKREIDVELDEEGNDDSDLVCLETDIQLPPRQRTSSVEEIGFALRTESAIDKEHVDNGCSVVFVDTNAFAVPGGPVIKSESLQNDTSSSDGYNAAGISQKDESNAEGDLNVWLPEDSKDFLVPDLCAQLPNLSHIPANTEPFGGILYKSTESTEVVYETDVYAGSRSSTHFQKSAVHQRNPKRNSVKPVKSDNVEKPYECEICTKKLSNKSHLTNHLRMHTGEKPFECYVCPKKFCERSKLVRHLATHNAQKSYECEICAKKFNLGENLKRHLQTHNGEKPYDCNVCAKKFRRRSHLVCHSKIHSDEKPYDCEVCAKKFREKSSLVLHLRIHNDEKPYECKVCARKFRQSSQLVCHLRVHNGEKPYECEFCAKKFKERRSLVHHLQKHNGEKLYECEKCAKKFHVRSDLILHLGMKNCRELCESFNWQVQRRTF